MAGIYVHIPFCKTKCHYCDFYKTTDKGYEEAFVHALFKEMELKQRWLQNETVNTIYFGGGTPSFIKLTLLEKIFEQIYKLFNISADAEVTLEMNPDDISPQWIKDLLKATTVNRTSVGVQSFRDKDLGLMNRRHSAQEAAAALQALLDGGLPNVSIDLIYGIPGLTNHQWLDNLERAFAFPIKHLSAYHLTFEPGTQFYKWKSQKKLLPLQEEESIRQFNTLLDFLPGQGFEQYEISNFSLPGMHSCHNSNYWLGKPYLGFGPSAHSFVQQQRYWNVQNLSVYIKKLETAEPFYEQEHIHPQTWYNEQIMTGLRTKWGVPLHKMQDKNMLAHLENEAEKYLASGHVELKNGILTLTRSGLFISDLIMSDLMWVDEDFHQTQ